MDRLSAGGLRVRHFGATQLSMFLLVVNTTHVDHAPGIAGEGLAVELGARQRIAQPPTSGLARQPGGRGLRPAATIRGFWPSLTGC